MIGSNINKERLLNAINYRIKNLNIGSVKDTLLHLGLSFNTYSSLAYRKFYPSINLLKRICEMLKLNLQSFIDNTNEFNPTVDIKNNQDIVFQKRSNTFTQALYTILNFLQKKNNSLFFNLFIVDKNNAIILVKLFDTLNSPTIYIYIRYKNCKVYSTYNRANLDIKYLQKIDYTNYVLIDNDLLDTYNNIIQIDKLKYGLA